MPIRQRPLGAAGSRCRQLENPQPMNQWRCPLKVSPLKRTRQSPQPQSRVTPQERQDLRRGRLPRLVHLQQTLEQEQSRDETVIQCSKSTLKVRDREPRSSEQRRTRASRSSSRRSMQAGSAKGREGCSPSPVARVHPLLDAGLRSRGALL